MNDVVEALLVRGLRREVLDVLTSRLDILSDSCAIDGLKVSFVCDCSVEAVLKERSPVRFNALRVQLVRDTGQRYVGGKAWWYT